MYRSSSGFKSLFWGILLERKILPKWLLNKLLSVVTYSKKKKKKGFTSTWFEITLELPHRDWMFQALQVIVCQKRCNNHLLILVYPKCILVNGIHDGEGQFGFSRSPMRVTEVADRGNSIIWWFFQVLNLIHLDLPAPFASLLSVSARTAYYFMVPIRIFWIWQRLRIQRGLECSRKSFLFASTWFSLYLYSCYDWRWSIMKVAGLSIQWVVGRLNWPRSVGWQSLISTRSRAFR